ncbi:hypothetical protein [Teredinibacter purpureus]|jgi:hypothetical protein|uniref:hypothetical protein n=1 Tax=Teredinibacter purpureus TaxID=2731756 RepID=UPI0006962461|nr:hypothetical protein [Teredinibacter purpureus]
MTTLTEKNYTRTTAPISQPFGELYDTVADWFDIRVAEMSGFDYVFAPMELCDQITDFVTLQEFLQNVQTVIHSEADRTILIGFCRTEDGAIEMDRYDVEWANDMIIDCRRSALNGTPQYEFVEMMLKHSEKLINDV